MLSIDDAKSHTALADNPLCRWTSEAWLLALLAMFFTLDAHACIARVYGDGYRTEELIDKAETIVLVELSNKELTGNFFKYTLTVIETLKGSAQPSYEYSSSAGPYGGKHSDETFADHSLDKFWEENVGRSPIFLCGPIHVFGDGHQYLYFPELYRARKSAEIIRSKEDPWYQFVKERIADKNQ